MFSSGIHINDLFSSGIQCQASMFYLQVEFNDLYASEIHINDLASSEIQSQASMIYSQVEFISLI